MVSGLQRIVGKIGQAIKPEPAEEGLDNYRPGGFHPVLLGQVYGSKYRVLRKLGHGQYSTVWLVRDQETRKFWAMKVLSAECYDSGSGVDIFEVEILQHLRDKATQVPGSSFVTMLEDYFEHIGPNGRHPCLIFKVMGESMASFRQAFPHKGLPSPLVQRFTEQLLQALDCAHSCGVIHTDIQPGNILIRNSDESHLMSYLERKYPDDEVTDQTQHKIIRSEPLKDHYYGGDINLLTLDVALADWGVASWMGKQLTDNIQPQLLRAPEVLLEAPWDQTVDIWNLGALIPELIFGQVMFSGGPRSGYSLAIHLAEINALLGPFPQRLLSEARLKKARGMFDSKGNVLIFKLKRTVSLTERFEDLTGGEGPKMEAFIRALLAIDPRSRPTAEDALKDPWLSHEYTQNVLVERAR